jgi:hypothetical protein
VGNIQFEKEDKVVYFTSLIMERAVGLKRNELPENIKNSAKD